jgi:acyl-coenzyme A synthetase/AMP-(fatty) acid ligase
MRPNAHLTIYAKGVDPATRSETWTRSQVRDVVWEDRKAANVLRSGLLEADRVAVYIPMARGEQSIKLGDVIVRGLVEDTIGPAFTITALKAKYPDSATVRSVDKMDRGSLSLRHYQVGAS